MSTQIPYQENLGGIVALLPDGRVEFLHHEIRVLLDQINTGSVHPLSVSFDDYVVETPWVDLERFHLSAPAIAFVEITNLCNLRCKHCYAWSGPRRKHELETSKILELLDEFETLGVLQVFLTGGEVFAHRDAVSIIQHARRKSFSTQIFTNGTLLDKHKLASIPAGQSFFISFDTNHPERTIRGKMDFPRLRKIYCWMREYGHVLRTAISVHRHNVGDVEEIFAWCAENEFPRPQWLETHPIGRALLNPNILLSPSDVDDVFAVYERCMDRYQHAPDEHTDVDLSGQPLPDETATIIRGVETIKFCQRLERATGQEKCGRSVAYVTSQGIVYPCSNCMSNDAYVAGNIRELSFAEIWHRGFDAFRDIGFDAFSCCKECPVHKDNIWCQFRCPPLAQNVSGEVPGCGATEYLRRFMIRSNAYWKRRSLEGYRLKLSANRRFRPHDGNIAHPEREGSERVSLGEP